MILFVLATVASNGVDAPLSMRSAN